MSNSTSEIKKQTNQQGTQQGGNSVLTQPPSDEVGVHAEEAPQQQQLPPEREKNIKRRPGFDYFLATIELKKGLKFGLGIKHYRNQVIVSKVDDGSMCAEALSVFDHICDVDGNPVTDKDVTKTLLVKSLQKNHSVSLLVARPACQEAGEMMEQALNAADEKPPSLTVAADVRDIMRKLQAKIQQNKTKPKSILTVANNKPKKNVSFMKEDGRDHKSVMIMTDISCIEKLQKVKKPEPPTPTPALTSARLTPPGTPTKDANMATPTTPESKKSTSGNSKNKQARK